VDALATRVLSLESQSVATELYKKNVTAELMRIETNMQDPIHAGDIAWMMTSTALVLMMTIPGLALFYGGMVRVTNVLSTLMQCFSIVCLITVEWMCVGYSLTFSEGGPVYGDYKRFWLVGMNLTHGHPMAPHIPEPLFVAYELMFAIITPVSLFHLKAKSGRVRR